MRITVAIVAAALSLPGAIPAAADTLSLKGRFNHWAVYKRERPGETLCYAVTKPRAWSPAEAGEAPAWLYISTFLEDGARDQISVTAGAPLDQGVQPAIVIGRERFDLVAKGKRAYMEDGKVETALRRAMARGRSLKVEAVSRAGNLLEYYYSLRGSAAAIKFARSNCK